ncbi:MULTISPECIES: DegT/DnrJ/EryC1/StrS family aminotransferase [Halobacterium]|uniref:DegT/DnrJ/EryC1/StrS family aminotransferase n=1 Tax=Halobacterium TaxID=2239 RepID=UPI0019653F95|nr:MULTISPECIES: DegT/DnrJ/EryC1/StrS family aminotransferase [Halobacterium]MCF2207522.1 DegT/DnrJ/EryC1/StrS family aminotransferase [Halobacterium salinarum]MCF2240714.1 DegT/DnrJ/EryC1/StrS family aminotransferase [Halobacterium salinarum]QRY23499.1 DegT/DnrJ/EryC1/StrS family aminotransferase [Halobacterium sp. GSL-19]WJK62936.1 DegT/DnrJ/EryC1/StrS family aminotransferase [Halobacterium salinarum]
MTRTPARYGGDPIRDTTLGYGGQSIDARDKEAVADALDGDYITRGPTVQRFEERIADVVGVDHAVVTTSGTTALHLAGRAAGWGDGDEVITTPLTFASTAHAATYTGAEPVFADIDSETRGLDPDAVRDQITADTVGLIPMHYGGHPADIEGLLEVADDHNLTVIWDACHGFGGTWDGEGLGAQRDMASFSFHPVKNITTGEGGAVVTDDEDLAARLRSLRSFNMDYNPSGHEDQPWYQVVEGLGYNYNMTDMQAALGLAQLDRLDAFKSRRDEIIRQYDKTFADVSGIRTPPATDGASPFYHLYAVEIGTGFGCDRGEFVAAMHSENIGVQVHYVPLHYHPFFQEEYGYQRGDFPVTEAVYDGLVSLPLFPEMTDEDIEDVITAVRRIQSYHAE